MSADTSGSPDPSGTPDTSDPFIAVAPLNRTVLESYPYARNVPLRGLYIDGKPALSGIDPGRVGDYVILTVRDPLCAYDADPAEQIAGQLDAAEPIGRTGMFSTWTGTYQGAPISVVSGGSGSPEAELIMHELLENTSATTFVRVGGSGGMHPSVQPGDLVVARGVVRDEGMTAAYVPASWPAACDPAVVLALSQAAHTAGARFHVGLTRSTDSDFVSGGRPGVGGYLQPRHTRIVDEWARAGVLNGDRESAAVVTLSGLFGRRGGAICSVSDNISTGAAFVPGAGHGSAVDVALEGLALLHRMDQAASKAGLPMWLPRVGLPDRKEELR
ncbi:MAG: nucleoside phosphorylase [Frankia sp.]